MFAKYFSWLTKPDVLKETGRIGKRSSGQSTETIRTQSAEDGGQRLFTHTHHAAPVLPGRTAGWAHHPKNKVGSRFRQASIKVLSRLHPGENPSKSKKSRLIQVNFFARNYMECRPKQVARTEVSGRQRNFCIAIPHCRRPTLRHWERIMTELNSNVSASAMSSQPSPSSISPNSSSSSNLWSMGGHAANVRQMCSNVQFMCGNVQQCGVTCSNVQ